MSSTPGLPFAKLQTSLGQRFSASHRCMQAAQFCGGGCPVLRRVLRSISGVYLQGVSGTPVLHLWQPTLLNASWGAYHPQPRTVAMILWGVAETRWEWDEQADAQVRGNSVVALASSSPLRAVTLPYCPTSWLVMVCRTGKHGAVRLQTLEGGLWLGKAYGGDMKPVHTSLCLRERMGLCVYIMLLVFHLKSLQQLFQVGLSSPFHIAIFAAAA